jgi:hypothetical protein
MPLLAQFFELFLMIRRGGQGVITYLTTKYFGEFLKIVVFIQNFNFFKKKTRNF